MSATALLLGLLVGCDMVTSVGPGEDPPPLQATDRVTVGPGIEVTLQAPDTVTLGDSFRVQARTENQTDHAVTVVSGSAGMYRFGVYDGDEVVPVKGSMRLYAAVQTEFPVAPGASTGEFDLRAVRASDAESPIAPGAYTTRLWLNWRIDGTAVQDTLETTLVFRDE